MNERIKELAKQAGIAVWGDAVYMYDPKDTLDSTVMEKFAELIVRECAEQSMSIGRYNTPSNITPDLAIAIAIGLKKHFGIES
jgi:hypothetical protein